MKLTHRLGSAGFEVGNHFSMLSSSAPQVTTYRIYNVVSSDPQNPLRTASSGVDADSASGWGPEAEGAVDEVSLLQHIMQALPRHLLAVHKEMGHWSEQLPERGPQCLLYHLVSHAAAHSTTAA